MVFCFNEFMKVSHIVTYHPTLLKRPHMWSICLKLQSILMIWQEYQYSIPEQSSLCLSQSWIHWWWIRTFETFSLYCRNHIQSLLSPPTLQEHICCWWWAPVLLFLSSCNPIIQKESNNRLFVPVSRHGRVWWPQKEHILKLFTKYSLIFHLFTSVFVYFFNFVLRLESLLRSRIQFNDTLICVKSIHDFISFSWLELSDIGHVIVPFICIHPCAW